MRSPFFRDSARCHWNVGSRLLPTTNPAVLSLLELHPEPATVFLPRPAPKLRPRLTIELNIPHPELSQPQSNRPTFLPLAFQPFGYPQAKNFVYAYSQQANLTFEHDLGGGYALSLAYNFNGGRHLNRPINANTIRGDLMTANYVAASRPSPPSADSRQPLHRGNGSSPCGVGPVRPWVSAPLMNFFRPRRPESLHCRRVPSSGGGRLRGAGASYHRLTLPGFNTACNPTRQTASPTPAASPSATWMPTTPTAVRSITD